MRRANEAIIRERHPIPTVEEVLQEINGNVYFSELDFRSGYHQIVLEKNSRDITTFVTPQGLFRYKRLLFGVNSAPEKFQNIIEQVLYGMEGVRNISDNVIVFGKDEEEHDRRLESVLQRVAEVGLKLNKEKCKFRQTELVFFGHMISKKGIDIHSKKVEALLETREPHTQQETKSFLGLVNFCAKFLPHIASITEPLRKLTKKNEPFVWGQEQQNAFDKIKQLLTKTKTLSYFDQQRKTRLIVDASPVGLGAVLTQMIPSGEYCPIAFASRALSDVEKRYSQTEKEALAVVWGIEHFHIYLFGTHFELVTDHKPLEKIYSTTSKPPARIERWVLRLAPYNFTVIYRPGSTNVADPLSRLLPTVSIPSYDDAECYIHMLETTSLPIAYTHDQLKAATEKDEELQNVKHAIFNNSWSKENINKGFINIKEELSTYDGVILRQNRIVIPQDLRKQTIDLAHEGHQRMVKTKQIMKTKVWWRGMEKDTEEYIKSCHACQTAQNGKCSYPEPLKSTILPAEPWQHVAIDLCGPFPSGETIFVLIDYYSRWPEVAILHSTTTSTIIHTLNVIFSRHGYPETITSDNGPQFTSKDFQQFLLEINVRHRKITPYWPQANGEVERFNRVLLKVCRTAKAEGKDWKKEIPKFLLQYRSTNHQTTGISPAELLLGRQLRTKMLNTGHVVNRQTLDRQVKMTDKINKDRTKYYADSHNNARPTDIAEGDKVLLKQEKTNKLSLPFEPSFYKVIEKKGNSVVLQNNDGVTKQRNVTLVKKYNDSRQTESTPRSIELFDEPNLQSQDMTVIEHSQTTDLTVDSENEWTRETFVRKKGIGECVDREEKTKNTDMSDKHETNIRRSSRQKKTPVYLKDYALNVT